MSDRANGLADRFEAVNAEVIAFVQGAPTDAWAAACAGEQCTVAALACHVGGSHLGVLEALVKPIVEGRPLPPIAVEQLHQMNAENAQTNATASKETALDLLRQGNDQVAAYVRGLDDGQLDRTGTLPFAGEPWTAEEVVERILTGHAASHLASMRAAAGG